MFLLSSFITSISAGALLVTNPETDFVLVQSSLTSVELLLNSFILLGLIFSACE